jgi:sulfide:quinone oxidoreductase
MELKIIDKGLSVSPQISADDVQPSRRGFRRDHLQPAGRRRRGPADVSEIEKPPRSAGLEIRYLPDRVGQGSRMPTLRNSAPSDRAAQAGACLLPHRHALGHPLVAGSGCKGHAATPTFSPPPGGGLRHGGVVRRIANGGKTPTDAGRPHDIVIVGEGPAGISVASSLKCPKPESSTSRSSTRRTCTTTSRAGPWSAAASSRPRQPPRPWGRSFHRACTGSRPPSRPSSQRTMRSSSMAAAW